MLDNVELITYMKFQKILMTGCRDMDKKHQKCPQNGVFPQFVTPKIFYKNRALSLLYLYGAKSSCKKTYSTNELSLKIFKGRLTQTRTDTPTDHNIYYKGL